MSLLVRTSTDNGALLVRDTDDPFALAVTESTSALALRVRESTSPLAMRVRGLFSPASLPGLAAWYDASDSSTVLTTVSPDVPATDGQTVRRWLDKSGNGRHLDESNITRQPQLAAGPTITFDAVDDSLRAAFTFGNDFTAILCGRNNGTTSGFRVLVPSATTATVPAIRGGAGTPTSQFSASDGTTNTASVTVNVAETAILTLYRDSAAAWGIGKGLGALQTATATFTGTLDGLVVGNRSDNVNPSNWSISDVIFYNRVLTAAERERVIRWLATKRGITV
jgi:hypothetical protein